MKRSESMNGLKLTVIRISNGGGDSGRVDEVEQ